MAEKKQKSEYDAISDKLVTTCSHLQEALSLDTVQILATRHVGDRTENWHPFVGNIYAVLKKAEVWVEIAHEALKEEIEENNCDDFETPTEGV